ncbi:tyrosine-type recombinase/integrase [Roseibacterium beibuensis]|uniref:tyrosine-type recombinase/integrase n=1 Tax=[Roseibacterium] beibuensis TaxID=1193142 RepID=UPI00217D9536|nr:tyrosine-type recombinase/integrase [Roseibacterium beibuensis]MCS6625397.1 tyrosine-type recombinase/integrase [Roseibacterium beibuensis]
MTRASVQARCLPVSEWPEQDQNAWALALEPYDAFDPTVGLASEWASATQDVMASGYGRWLNWLAQRDELDGSKSPGERATRARLQAYLESLRSENLAEFSIAGRIKQLGRMLQMIEPAGNWVWIVRAADSLHRAAQPKRDRREIMQPPEEILQLGLDLMDAAEHDRFRTDTDRAVLFRDGLLLAFLVQRPFRRSNLAGLALGQNLELTDVWQIRIEDDDTKNGAPISCDWPPALVDALERYLKVHRETLFRGQKVKVATQALWISKQGRTMGDDAIYCQIKARTKVEFGKAINPHTFRSIAATMIAESSPAESTAIMDVLGHGSMRSSERWYNQAGMRAAGEHFHRSLEAHRSRADDRVSDHEHPD